MICPPLQKLGRHKTIEIIIFLYNPLSVFYYDCGDANQNSLCQHELYTYRDGDMLPFQMQDFQPAMSEDMVDGSVSCSQ